MLFPAFPEVIATVMSNTQKKLILASRSPRRLSLLRQIAVEPDEVLPADIDESPLKDENPRDLARRLARTKAQQVLFHRQDAAILAADTVVVCGRRILPAPETVDAARTCLLRLSGRAHDVIGGISLVLDDHSVSRVVVTRVDFKRLSRAEIDWYLQSGEWHGKAGGYAIQGRAAAFVKRLRGSYNNVVGLDLHETVQLLHGVGMFRYDSENREPD